MDELDGHVAGVGLLADRQQPPAVQEALRHLVAQRRQARRLGAEELAVRAGPLRRHASTMRRSGSAASQSRKAFTPSPVRAESSKTTTPGWTASRRSLHFVRSKSMCASRSILLSTTSSQARNI